MSLLRSRSLALVACVLLGGVLTACSVGFTPAEPPAAGAPTQQSAVPHPATPAPDPTTAGQSPLREGALLKANAVTCSGGTLTIDEFAAVVHVTDACANLTVTGSSTTVIAEEVGTLTVAAFSPVVSVQSAKMIQVTSEASSARVEWMSGQPTVTDDGWATDIGPAITVG